MDSSNKTKKFTELFKRYNFIQNVKEPTRITRTSSTCLDVVCTNFNIEHVTINVRELGLSDHKGIEITVPYTKTNHSQSFCTRKRIFNHKNIALFKLHLQCIDWRKLVTANNNINQNYRAFHEQLVILLDQCIPKKMMGLRKNNKKSWLSTGLKISCRNKRLLKLLILQKDSSVLNKYYKGYEKVLKKAVKVAKKQYYIKKMEVSKNITKTMWQIIKERTNKINKKKISKHKIKNL